MYYKFQGLNIRAPKIAVIVAATLGLFLNACAQDLGSNTYSRSGVGQINQTVMGTVVSTRNVTIDGTNSRIGTGAGAIIGGVAGSNIGGSRDENIVGAVAGAVLGGMAGNAIERGVTRQSGIEYTIRGQDGRIFTIVQPAKSGLIYPGTPVRIVYGGDRARLVPAGYNQAYQGGYQDDYGYQEGYQDDYQGGYNTYPDDPNLIR